MTDETKLPPVVLDEAQPLTKPRKTRRPLSLTDKLLELRDQKRRALAERTLRLERVDTQRRELVGQIHTIEAELERVRLALGEARDNERADVVLEVPADQAEREALVRQLRAEPVRTVAVADGANGAPPTAAVVDVDQLDGTVSVVSQHDTVDSASRAIIDTRKREAEEASREHAERMARINGQAAP